MVPSRVALLAAAALAGMAAGCKRKHVAVDSVPDLGYPTCDDAEASSPRVLATGHIRSGPFSFEKDVNERFEIKETSCQVVLSSRQEWSRMSADVEAIYDKALLPLRVWKRMTIPGSNRADGHADIRRYELRGDDVTIKRRGPDGVISYEILKPGGKTAVAPGARVKAVVGPGRGVLTMWLQRAKLSIGGKLRELVLDFRDMVETLEVTTLVREEDRFEESLGKTVRVYTILGRESIFADENDVVIGDLAGMRPSDSLSEPEPPPTPLFGEPDPAHTP